MIYINKYVNKRYLLSSLMLGIVLWCTSCKEKPDPIPVVESPKLTASVELDGESWDIQAGVAGYKYVTDFELASDGYYYFTGAYENASGGPSLRFGVKDHTLRTPGESIDFENVLAVGTSEFIGKGTTTGQAQFKMNFSTKSQGTGLTYFWTFGDGIGEVSNAKNISHTYATAGPHQVTLTVDNGAGCTNSIQKNVYTEIQDSTCNAEFFIWPQFDTSGVNVLFIADTTGVSPVSYVWNFGNGSTAINQVTPTTYYTQQDIYTVCLTKVDATGCEAENCRNVAFTQTTPTCMANFDAEFIGSEIVNETIDVGNLFVEYYTATGQLYSTRLGDQSSQNITVTGITQFLADENGNPTKKLGFEFDCVLYNAAGQKIILTNGNAEAAVAYF